MKQENIVAADRTTVSPALVRAEATGAPAAAMELPDGRVITGKTGDLLGSSAALLLNALKELSGIDHDVHVLSPESIAPIQTLKTKYLGSKNPRLHTDEVLIALSAGCRTERGCIESTLLPAAVTGLPGALQRYALRCGPQNVPASGMRSDL